MREVACTSNKFIVHLLVISTDRRFRFWATPKRFRMSGFDFRFRATPGRYVGASGFGLLPNGCRIWRTFYYELLPVTDVGALLLVGNEQPIKIIELQLWNFKPARQRLRVRRNGYLFGYTYRALSRASEANDFGRNGRWMYK